MANVTFRFHDGGTLRTDAREGENLLEVARRSGVAIDPSSLRFTGLCPMCKDREGPDPNI